MIDQAVFNIVLTVAAALGGWYLKAMWDSVKDLRNADRELADKLAAIEVLVAGKYVPREHFERSVNELFRKLDRIYDKLDGKVDKNVAT